ncbi:ankyrin repeat domain-containing protein [Thaumasiovibrio sp. DFM-14]|uniref:ankyrin repeat domain-containing protein n=1 Tax=Thaumasiovibrio sp. DFM-14 TaxID=3384792 RepID=UPI0039A13F28
MQLGNLKIGFKLTVVSNVINQSGKRLESILRNFAELPEYSEVPLPSLNSKSLFGNYPINIAATRGLIGEVSILLENGADISAKGEHGYTPLHDAVEQGHIEIVKLLVDRGASIAVMNNDGITPIELAKLLNET